MSTPKPKKSRESDQHYVNNRTFSQAVVDYARLVKIARGKNQDDPVIPEYVGDCLLRIADGLSHRPNFAAYSYRDEMVMDAVENCLKVIGNYDIDKTTRTGAPNAFGYFTQICYYAFLRRIAKEKRHQDIKELYMEHAGIEAFADFDGDEGVDGIGIVERVRKKCDAIRERDRGIREFAKKKRASEKTGLTPAVTLDTFYDS